MLQSLRNLFRRRQLEEDLDAELHAFVDLLAAENRNNGMSVVDAQRAAHLELGGLEQVKEEVRQVRIGRLFEELLQDLRHGFRSLWKTPSFTTVALLALALGIGANTAMFSVAYGILARPLPYPDSARVMSVFMRYFPRDFAFGTLCIRDYLTWRQNNHVFENPSLFQTFNVDIGGQEGFPEHARGAAVTAGFFPTLQVNPLVGRTFAAGEDQPASRSLTVLGESIWRRRYAASPAVIGETILINGTPSTVIGVMPVRFQFPRPDTEVWTNLVLNPPSRYGPWFYRGVARLKPGVTPAQAQAEMNNIAVRMMQENPYYKRLRLPVLSVRDALLGTTLKPAILLLAGAVLLVLLIAIVNVANLMLARSTVREREIALRLSLGAGRGRVLRQLLTESVLLALMGGTGGLALAWAAIALIRVWNPGNLPFIDSVQLDGTALAFTFLLSTLAGVVFGLAPALEGLRTELNTTLKEGGRGAGRGRTGGRMRSTLVIAEVALSLTLLVGAGLLLRSFRNLQQVTAGITAPPSHILTMLLSPGAKKYADASAGLPFYQELLRRLRTLPGVEVASVTDSLPPDRQGDADTFGIEGQNLPSGQMNPILSVPVVGPDFFRALGIPLVSGRSFTDHDTPTSTPVAIVSEGFARRFYPSQNVLGKRIRQSEASLGNNWMQIVGVVGDVKYLGLPVDTDAAYYLPFAQSYGPRTFLAIRTSGDAAAQAIEIQRVIHTFDAGVTVAQVTTMQQALAESVSQPRFDTMLLSLFAGIALLLAAVGIYGLIAYSVGQRTQEIGVRMALGAARKDVLRMVVGQGAGLATIGVVIGLVGALALTRLLKTMLFGIGVTDTLTFVAAPAGMLLVVLLATLVPALRATRISPVAALRHE